MWAKITGVLGAIIGFLLIALKLKNAKIEKLEVKEAVNDKKNERREKQDKVIEEVFANEKESINKKVKDKPISDSDDYLDGL